MARVALPKSRVRAKRKQRRILFASIAVGAVFVFIGALAGLAHASFMRVSNVVVSGQSTLQASDIANLVRKDISGSYLFIFQKDNIFLYPKHQTEADLLQQMPTINKASVNAKDFHTLGVVVSERAPKALWCGNSVAGASACFWLDQDGLAYSAASDITVSDATTTTYEKYYGALTGDSPQTFLTADQFHALSALIDAIAQNQEGNSIQTVEVDSSNDVHVMFANNFELMFSLNSAGADVYQRFVLALGSSAFQGHQLSDFKYLDLRFGDKLYYKLK